MPPAAKKPSTAQAKAAAQPKASSKRIPLLPPPIRARIIKSLDPLDALDFRSLAAFARTTKADRAIARPLMYQAVVVSDPRESIFSSLGALMRSMRGLSMRARDEDDDEEDEEDDDWEDKTDDQERNSALDRPTKRLIKAFEGDPELAKLPTSLVYYGRMETYGAALAAERILELCPSISHVRLLAMEPGMFEDREHDYDDEGFSMLGVLSKQQARIKSLEVRRMPPYNSLEFFRIVPEFKNLSHLSFSVTRDEVWADLSASTYNAPPPAEHQLTSLDCGSVVEPPLFRSLIASSFSSLKHLTIAVRREPFDLSSLTSLSSLAIEYNRNEVARKTFKTASSSLTSLELRWSMVIDLDDGREAKYNSEYDEDSDWGDSEDDEDDEDDEAYEARLAAREAKAAKEAKEAAFKTLLAALPASLVRLFLSFRLDDGTGESGMRYSEGEKTEFDTLLAALNKATWLPNLAVLDVHDPAKADDGIGDGPTRSELRHYAKQRERLRKACEKKGTWLGPRAVGWWEAERDEGKLPRAF
ncbi:hypothetical protein JCM10213_008655 [Rhodosporidiobolus nylandii]